MVRYTVEDMRDAAVTAETVEVADQFYGSEMNEIAAMLRQSADTYEKIEGEIGRLEGLLVPTCGNCVFECAFTHGKEPCKNHTYDGSEVSLVENIKYLKEFINGGKA